MQTVLEAPKNKADEIMRMNQKLKIKKHKYKLTVAYKGSLFLSYFIDFKQSVICVELFKEGGTNRGLFF